MVGCRKQSAPHTGQEERKPNRPRHSPPFLGEHPRLSRNWAPTQTSRLLTVENNNSKYFHFLSFFCGRKEEKKWPFLQSIPPLPQWSTDMHQQEPRRVGPTIGGGGGAPPEPTLSEQVIFPRDHGQLVRSLFFLKGLRGRRPSPRVRPLICNRAGL